MLPLIYRVSVTDGGCRAEYETDGSERCAEGFIRENNLFFGETQNFADFDSALLTEGAAGRRTWPVGEYCFKEIVYRKQRCANDRIVRRITPKLIGKKDGKTLYDAGENVSGFVSFSSVDEEVGIVHAEILKDGKPDFSRCEKLHPKPGDAGGIEISAAAKPDRHSPEPGGKTRIKP